MIKRFLHKSIYTFSERPSFPLALSLEAVGYASQTVELSSQTDVETPVQMEYLQEINCQVIGAVQGKDVVVSLWEGPQVIRPVKGQATLRLGCKGVIQEIVVKRNAYDFSVISSRPISNPLEIQEETVPNIDDTLIGFSGYLEGFAMPVVSQTSERLRVWDSACLLNPGNQMDDGIYWENAILQRESQRFSCDLRKLDYSRRGRLIATAIADLNGSCRFENLQPGVYFIRAVQGNQKVHI